MGFKASLLMTICCFAFFQYSEYTYAGLPEECFKTPLDYDIYSNYGDKAVPPPGDKSQYKLPSGAFNVYVYENLLEASQHGAPQRSEIVIKVKDIQSVNYITIDASESKTPSGKIQFAWGDPDKPLSTESHISSIVSNKKIGESTLRLNVTDPVCGISKSVLAPYTVK